MPADDTATGTAMHADAPSACENCATPLQGAYCHVCGQHAANPLRHFGHAVEEFFESFWHLDGRVFRTLRDLPVPGRVACNYLAGQRVRYIAPLRLFIVLTLLTFFVGQIAVSVGAPSGPAATGMIEVQADGGGASDDMRAIREAETVAEVQAELARQLAELQQAREGTRLIPGVGSALDTAENQARAAAKLRIEVLTRASRPAGSTSRAPAPDARVATGPATGTTAATAADTREAPRAAAAPVTADVKDAEEARRELGLVVAKLGRLRDASQPWHPRSNPVDAAWVPAFADGWFNDRIDNMADNIERFERGGPALLFKVALAAVPPALFVLVPVFALLLRLLYPMTARGYLEHLVVALYSHATMLLVLMATFVLSLLRVAFSEVAAVTVPAGILTGIVWAALPVYLFAMQQRVYRQHWLATAAKYVVLGIAYVFLVTLVVVYSLVAAITGSS